MLSEWRVGCTHLSWHDGEAGGGEGRSDTSQQHRHESHSHWSPLPAGGFPTRDLRIGCSCVCGLPLHPPPSRTCHKCDNELEPNDDICHQSYLAPSAPRCSSL